MDPDEYCQHKAAQSGSSFYYSFLFLPPERRRAITALYAFCREVDDVVDECTDTGVARTKLAWWRQELAAVYAGEPQHPVARRSPRRSGLRLQAASISPRSSTAWRWTSSTTAIPTSPRWSSTATASPASSACCPPPSSATRTSARCDYAQTLGLGVPAHQHHPRRRRGRAPRSHLPSARRTAALRRERGRYPARARRPTLRPPDGIPDRTCRAATTPGFRAIAAQSTARAQRAGLIMAAIYRTLLEEIEPTAARCSTSASR